MSKHRSKASPLLFVLSGLALLALGLTSSVALAADWHVAPGGDNQNDGSQGKPLATLAEAVTRASAKDRILLARGGTYQVDDLTIGKELTVTAYGSGAAPVITASEEVTLGGTWAQNGQVQTGNVAKRVVACFVDGRFVRRARYPNDPDVLFTDGDNGDSTIKDADLAKRPGVAAGRWTGAHVRWRRWSWHWERRIIQAHSATDTLKLTADGRVTNVGDVGDGSGYYIDNDLDELDVPGEWHWENGKLYLYPPTWANPQTMRVTVVTSSETAAWIKLEDLKAGVSASGKAVFRDVHFSMFRGAALRIAGPATVERCTFSEIGETAVRYTWNAQPFTVRESVFRDIRNVGVQGWADPAGVKGSLIERNLFLRIGYEKGYGGNGPWHAAGVILGNGNGITFRLNRVVDTGYCGIILGSPGMVVERNVFVRTMSTLNDGGAVYTNCDASVIRENIILDTIGDLSTSHPWYPLGSGIWPEFLSEFKKTQIIDNTVYGSNGQGIFLPNNYECTITGNVLLDNRRAGMALMRHNSNPAYDPKQRHTIQDNVMGVVEPTRRLKRAENLSKWWLPPHDPPPANALLYDLDVDYGLMEGSTMVVPPGYKDVIQAEPGGGSGTKATYETIQAWTQNATWASATGSSVVLGHAILLFNDTEAKAKMTVPAGSWKHLDGSAAGATVNVDPFRSVVLVAPSAPPATPPYYAASGIDWRADTPTSSVLTPEPDIELLRGAKVIALGATDEVFGSEAGTAVTIDYIIRNGGGASLTLAVPATTSKATNVQATVKVQPAASLAPGASATLSVELRPTAAGAWSVELSVGTNDPDEDPMTWRIYGTTGSTGGPDLGVSPVPDGGSSPVDGGGGDGGLPGDGGAVDAASDGGGSGSLDDGCAVGGASSAPLLAIALLGLLALGLRRRRDA